jgi:hypothetical protein
MPASTTISTNQQVDHNLFSFLSLVTYTMSAQCAHQTCINNLSKSSSLHLLPLIPCACTVHTTLIHQAIKRKAGLHHLSPDPVLKQLAWYSLPPPPPAPPCASQNDAKLFNFFGAIFSYAFTTWRTLFQRLDMAGDGQNVELIVQENGCKACPPCRPGKKGRRPRRREQTAGMRTSTYTNSDPKHRIRINTRSRSRRKLPYLFQNLANKL